MSAAMTSAQRMGAALSFKEGDRVPFFLPVSLHPARMLGLPLIDYFHDAGAVVEGQLKMRALLGHDAVTSFLYGAAEVEAFGGEVIFRTDGPPNTGRPPLRRPADVEHLRVPDPMGVPSLARTLAVARGLHSRLGDDAPIIGGLIGPLSLPVIQLGFETYLDWLMDAPNVVRRLWQINADFCVAWANAQFEAGAGAVGMAEPLLSPTLMPSDLMRREGFGILRDARARMRGAVALSTASAPLGALLADVAQLGFTGIAPSCADSLAGAKSAFGGRAALMGGLNGLAMSHWSAADADAAVREAFRAAAAGGGFVLSEHHGEIPWAVPDAVLVAVSEAVQRWGSYPLGPEVR